MIRSLLQHLFSRFGRGRPTGADRDGAAGPPASAGLDTIIPPEIKGDRLYDLILSLASREPVETILEIGSSSGGGSTEAFVRGIGKNPRRPTLFCMEVSKTRFAALAKRYSGQPFVRCYNVSSVPPDRFMTGEEIAAFYRSTPTSLNNYPLERVLEWARQDVAYIRDSGVPSEGIRLVKRENRISSFGMVLIDGSAFAGQAELEEVHGAAVILLDDINDIKNHANFRRLTADGSYEAISVDMTVRNGFAAFRRKAP